MNIVPALSLGASLLVPIADQVPTLDVAASCRAAANIAIADRQSYDACFKDEMSARDQLAKSWQSFRAVERSTCTSEASSAGAPSYVELLVCLQLAHDADANSKTQLRGARRR
jgi:hypothetical protein